MTTNKIYNNKKGGILIAMLGILLIMSFVVLEFLNTSTEKIVYKSQIRGLDELKTTAYNVLNINLAVFNEINAIEKGIFSPVQKWNKPLKYAKISFPKWLKVEVEIDDCCAKFPLLKIDKKWLIPLLNQLKIPDSNKLADDLIAWTDQNDKIKESKNDDTKEKSDITMQSENEFEKLNKKDEKHKKSENKFKCLISYDDLKNIKSFKDVFFDSETAKPNKNFEKFKNSTSLFSSFPVNINTTSQLIRKILNKIEQMDIEKMEKFLYDKNKKLAKFYKSIDELEKSKVIHKKNDKIHKKNDKKKSKKKDEKKKEDEKQTEKKEDEKKSERFFDVRSQLFSIKITVSKGDVKFILSSLIKIKPQKLDSKEDKKDETKKIDKTKEQNDNKNESIFGNIKEDDKNEKNDKKKLDFKSYLFTIMNLTECLQN